MFHLLSSVHGWLCGRHRRLPILCHPHWVPLQQATGVCRPGPGLVARSLRHLWLCRQGPGALAGHRDLRAVGHLCPDPGGDGYPSYLSAPDHHVLEVAGAYRSQARVRLHKRAMLSWAYWEQWNRTIKLLQFNSQFLFGQVLVMLAHQNISYNKG